MNSLPLNSAPINSSSANPSVAMPTLDDVLAEIEQQIAKDGGPVAHTAPAAVSLATPQPEPPSQTQVVHPTRQALTGLLQANLTKPGMSASPASSPTEVTPEQPTPAPLQLETTNDLPTFEQHTRALNESNLSDRQKALPKLELAKIVGTILMAIMLTVGVGTGVYVTQQSQDIRQQAYEGTEVVLPDGTAHKPNVNVSENADQAVLAARMPKASYYGNIIIISAALVIAFLIVWLFWA